MKHKVLTGVSFLLGAMMINSGFNKFLNYMPVPEMNEAAGATMAAFIQSGWLFPLVAVVEIIAGALLFSKKFRALGAIMLLPIIIGILLFHAVQDSSTLPIAVVLLAINGWIIFENKDRYLPMIK
jgi:putative oxidoreductase